MNKFNLHFCIISLCIFTSFTSKASSTPNYDQQNCLQRGGQLSVLKITLGSNKSYEFCLFFGDQGMETHALNRGWGNPYSGPEANRAYRNTSQYTMGACARQNGRQERAIDEKNRARQICTFWDGSAIDNRTLEQGVSSVWNRELNQALGIF